MSPQPDANVSSRRGLPLNYRCRQAAIAAVLLLSATGGWWFVQRPEDPQSERRVPRFVVLDEDGGQILTDEQIVSYEWVSHRITLKSGETLKVRIERLVHGMPFTIVVGGVACYSGVVTTSLSSCSQSVPVINVLPAGGGKIVVRIELGYPSREYFKGIDPRADERIRQELRASGKLRE